MFESFGRHDNIRWLLGWCLGMSLHVHYFWLCGEIWDSLVLKVISPLEMQDLSQSCSNGLCHQRLCTADGLCLDWLVSSFLSLLQRLKFSTPIMVHCRRGKIFHRFYNTFCGGAYSLCMGWVKDMGWYLEAWLCQHWCNIPQQQAHWHRCWLSRGFMVWPPWLGLSLTWECRGS